MTYLSVCSGIEAASVAWHPLAWKPWAFAEVEQFPSAVLEARWPGVPNLGDITQWKDWPDAAIDLLVGGTPCQSFSVAGLRKGLDDPRGGLLFAYLAIARRYRPRWVVWENVPGVLSIDGGRAFGSLLGGLAELGYGFAYRVLDAQFFGLAQRRQRVFVVGHLGDWRRAAAVLFERASLSGHPAPRRAARESVAPSLAARTRGGGGLGTDFDLDGGLIAGAVSAKWAKGTEDGSGRGTPLVSVPEPYTLAIRGRGDSHQLEYRQDGTANAILTPNGGRAGIGVGAVAFDAKQITNPTHRRQPKDQAGAIYAGGGEHVATSMAVRRLTPRECERLMGFPDDYTLIPYRGKPAADGPRYKALGNSMAVPVMRWIGQRIQMVEAL